MIIKETAAICAVIVLLILGMSEPKADPDFQAAPINVNESNVMCTAEATGPNNARTHKCAVIITLEIPELKEL